ncbi:hypothetical protein EON83_00015 [bacterium]|nr:MAG: hypothetical protein EON83_00015 [bacterium]
MQNSPTKLFVSSIKKGDLVESLNRKPYTFTMTSEMKSVSGDLLQKLIEEHGPQRFTKRELNASSDLFGERCALFYTPTECFPEEWVGHGNLDVTLPVATPSYYEFYESRLYQTPRFWVDLLQRATGKIRWTPFFPAHVTIIRYDSISLPYHFLHGAKALLDSLKVSTTGRSDGLYLHYFGAIVDDSPDHVQTEYRQQLVSHPSQARTRIIVSQSNLSGPGLRVITDTEPIVF